MILPVLGLRGGVRPAGERRDVLPLCLFDFVFSFNLQEIVYFQNLFPFLAPLVYNVERNCFAHC